MVRKAKEEVGIVIEPEPEMSPEVEAMIEEDKQYWNYQYDITPDQDRDLPRWKYGTACNQELFEWQLWGKTGHLWELQVLATQLVEMGSNEVQFLGDQEVRLVEADSYPPATLEQLRALENEPEVFIIEGGIDSRDSDGHGLIFYSTMAHYQHHRNGHRNHCRFGQGRGAPPMSVQVWNQPPWAGMPFYPPYMGVPTPPNTFYSGDYKGNNKDHNDQYQDFHPPLGPHAEMSPLANKCHNTEAGTRECSQCHDSTKNEDSSHTSQHESDKGSELTQTRKCRSLSPTHRHHSLSPDEIPKPRHCSPSPDILGMFTVDEENEEEEPLILLNIPQLEGPLVFSEEALKTWGHVHIDNSEQSIHFHTQLREWKHTKVEL